LDTFGVAGQWAIDSLMIDSLTIALRPPGMPPSIVNSPGTVTAPAYFGGAVVRLRLCRDMLIVYQPNQFNLRSQA
jgi:hypothetical protein